MAEHPNVARIRRGYEIRGTRTAFSDSDWAEIRDLFHEDLVFHGLGTSRYSQDFVGRDEFYAVERQFAERGLMHQEVHEIYADDVHAIAMAVIHARNGDIEATWREAQVFHFDADGKVTDTWGIPADQSVVDAFWETFEGSGAQG